VHSSSVLGTRLLDFSPGGIAASGLSVYSAGLDTVRPQDLDSSGMLKDVAVCFRAAQRDPRGGAR